MRGLSYKKRLMVTKSVRLPEDLLKRVEEQLWNEDMNQVPFGRQAEFYSTAVRKELERLEGKNIDIAIDELSQIYVELGKCNRIDSNGLVCINNTIAILKTYKSIKGEEIAAIK